MREAEFIATLRPFATHPAARSLADDAAVLGDLVLTHDMIAEGVHFLADADPRDVAWRLVAVNLSDLAAKGAEPVGVLLGYALGDGRWDFEFVEGLGEALAAFDVALLGGDTLRPAIAAPRTLGLTAIGRVPASGAPSRAGSRAGDTLWVTGVIGDAGAGLELAMARAREPASLLEAYQRPRPLLADGRVLAPLVHAMMDVSDGLLIDASRMATASGLAVEIDLGAVPLSDAYRAFRGDDRAARVAAATAGDDYQLLFALDPDLTPPVAATLVGRFADGAGVTLIHGGTPIPLPAKLGFEH